MGRRVLPQRGIACCCSLLLSLLLTVVADVQITFPVHALDGFSCHAEEVRASYKYKHLKAAFTHVAQKEAWSAKVVPALRAIARSKYMCILLSALTVQIAISSRGVLRVTHMLTLAGGGPLAPLEAQPLLGTLTSQVVDVGCGILIMYTATATPLMMVDL